MSEPPPVTLADMIDEVRVELGYRRYAAQTGRMNARRAARRIDVMTAVLEYLEREERDGRTTVER